SLTQGDGYFPLSHGTTQSPALDPYGPVGAHPLVRAAARDRATARHAGRRGLHDRGGAGRDPGGRGAARGRRGPGGVSPRRGRRPALAAARADPPPRPRAPLVGALAPLARAPPALHHGGGLGGVSQAPSPTPDVLQVSLDGAFVRLGRRGTRRGGWCYPRPVRKV